MLRRSICLVMILALLTMLSGCFVAQSTYRLKEEEAETLSKNVADLDKKNKDLTSQNEKLQVENNDLKKQVAAKDDLLQKKSEEIARQDAKQAAMVSELDRMKAQLAKSKQTTIEESAPAKKPTGLKSIRMKVLSGDGKVASAKKMAKRLTSMGYKVEGVGMADHSDYPAHTIYFASKYKKEAKALAKKLGKETITKPLTWKSVFSLIVVTGG